jgi:hypothetical protein
MLAQPRTYEQFYFIKAFVNPTVQMYTFNSIELIMPFLILSHIKEG